jgi:hypothetical protein
MHTFQDQKVSAVDEVAGKATTVVGKFNMGTRSGV